jgi:signal transduction histidine kinase
VRPTVGNRLGDALVTSTETGSSGSQRLNPRNWPLVWKLVAVGLLPALLAVVLGVLRVADQAQAAAELGRANRLLDVRAQVADAAEALREERDRATLYVAERRLGDRRPLQESIGRADAALAKARTSVAGVDDLDATTRAAAQQDVAGAAELSVLRSDVAGSGPLATAQVVQRYTAVIQRADVLDRALLRQLSTPEVAGLADALRDVTAASEALELQHTVLGGALRAGAVSAEDRAASTTADTAFATALANYQVALPPTLQAQDLAASPANAQRESVKDAILAAPSPGPIPVAPATWDDAVAQTRNVLDSAGTAVRNELVTTGRTAEDRSSNLAGVNSVILMLGLLLTAAIIVLVARGLTQSLRLLRSTALEVAQHRLPAVVETLRSGGKVGEVAVEPVPVHTRDEVGQVARAFDAVHGQALRLAADQAALQANVSAMFVNLSRRSQALVERQLKLIEHLESNEQDPDQLSNLFQLDHLATRMRRNSENLLVLAGTDLAKRNTAPVPLVDVLRAAVSEVEQYQRVVVQSPPQVSLVGRAASDVVHLLAELLDNATNFSPPDSQVVMSSSRTTDGSVLVEIADRGVGMDEAELAEVNRRLRTPSAVDVSASRRMGLFVVGRLAARHGVDVHLGGAPMGGPGGGLTASVTLPAHLAVGTGDTGGRLPRVGTPPAAMPPGGSARLGRPALSGPRPRVNGSAPTRNGLPTRLPGSSLRRDDEGSSPEPGRPDTADARAGGPDGGRSDAAPAHPGTADAAGPEPAEPETSEQPITPASAGDPADGAAAADEAAAAEPVDGAPERDGAADRPDAPGVAPTGLGAAPAAVGTREARPDAQSHPASGDAAPGSAPGRSGAQPEASETAADRRGPAPDAPTASGPATLSAPDRREAPADPPAPAAAMPSAPEAPESPSGPDAPESPATRSGPEAADPAAAPAALPTPDAPSTPGTREAPALPRNGAPDPRHGPNGTYADLTPPSLAHRDGTRRGPAAQVPFTPPTTPMPVVPPGAAQPPAAHPDREANAAEEAEELFAANVPSIGEPDGLLHSRRPIGELRRGPVDIGETTPIFEEIASAWFASDRPVPVDWELGSGPWRADAAEPAVEATGPATGRPVDLLAKGARSSLGTTVAAPSARGFASAADEGWRAADGAAADRPGELTAAGLPKRRPRARLVPGSAGSAVLAAPVAPTRSAESIRGRLASYQQGVRQGREVRDRLGRRDPERGGPLQTAGENAAAPAGGGHDEES